MSKRLVILADHRTKCPETKRPETNGHPAVSSNPHAAVSAAAQNLVAAARALAASMEKTQAKSATLRQTYRWLAVAAQAIVLDTEAVLSSIQKLSGLRTTPSRT